MHNNTTVTDVYAQQYNYDKHNRVDYLFSVCWKNKQG